MKIPKEKIRKAFDNHSWLERYVGCYVMDENGFQSAVKELLKSEKE